MHRRTYDVLLPPAVDASPAIPVGVSSSRRSPGATSSSGQEMSSNHDEPNHSNARDGNDRATSDDDDENGRGGNNKEVARRVATDVDEEEADGEQDNGLIVEFDAGDDDDTPTASYQHRNRHSQSTSASFLPLRRMLRDVDDSSDDDVVGAIVKKDSWSSRLLPAGSSKSTRVRKATTTGRGDIISHVPSSNRDADGDIEATRRHHSATEDEVADARDDDVDHVKDGDEVERSDGKTSSSSKDNDSLSDDDGLDGNRRSALLTVAMTIGWGCAYWIPVLWVMAACFESGALGLMYLALFGYSTCVPVAIRRAVHVTRTRDGTRWRVVSSLALTPGRIILVMSALIALAGMVLTAVHGLWWCGSSDGKARHSGSLDNAHEAGWQKTWSILGFEDGTNAACGGVHDLGRHAWVHVMLFVTSVLACAARWRGRKNSSRAVLLDLDDDASNYHIHGSFPIDWTPAGVILAMMEVAGYWWVPWIAAIVAIILQPSVMQVPALLLCLSYIVWIERFASVSSSSSSALAAANNHHHNGSSDVNNHHHHRLWQWIDVFYTRGIASSRTKETFWVRLAQIGMICKVLTYFVVLSFLRMGSPIPEALEYLTSMKFAVVDDLVLQVTLWCSVLFCLAVVKSLRDLDFDLAPRLMSYSSHAHYHSSASSSRRAAAAATSSSNSTSCTSPPRLLPRPHTAMWGTRTSVPICMALHRFAYHAWYTVQGILVFCLANVAPSVLGCLWLLLWVVGLWAGSQQTSIHTTVVFVGLLQFAGVFIAGLRMYDPALDDNNENKTHATVIIGVRPFHEHASALSVWILAVMAFNLCVQRYRRHQDDRINSSRHEGAHRHTGRTGGGGGQENTPLCSPHSGASGGGGPSFGSYGSVLRDDEYDERHASRQSPAAIKHRYRSSTMASYVVVDTDNNPDNRGTHRNSFAESATGGADDMEGTAALEDSTGGGGATRRLQPRQQQLRREKSVVRMAVSTTEHFAARLFGIFSEIVRQYFFLIALLAIFVAAVVRVNVLHVGFLLLFGVCLLRKKFSIVAWGLVVLYSVAVLVTQYAVIAFVSNPSSSLTQAGFTSTDAWALWPYYGLAAIFLFQFRLYAITSIAELSDNVRRYLELAERVTIGLILWLNIMFFAALASMSRATVFGFVYLCIFVVALVVFLEVGSVHTPSRGVLWFWYVAVALNFVCAVSVYLYQLFPEVAEKTLEPIVEGMGLTLQEMGIADNSIGALWPKVASLLLSFVQARAWHARTSRRVEEAATTNMHHHHHLASNFVTWSHTFFSSLMTAANAFALVLSRYSLAVAIPSLFFGAAFGASTGSTSWGGQSVVVQLIYFLVGCWMTTISRAMRSLFLWRSIQVLSTFAVFSVVIFQFPGYPAHFRNSLWVPYVIVQVGCATTTMQWFVLMPHLIVFVTSSLHASFLLRASHGGSDESGDIVADDGVVDGNAATQPITRRMSPTEQRYQEHSNSRRDGGGVSMPLLREASTPLSVAGGSSQLLTAGGGDESKSNRMSSSNTEQHQQQQQQQLSAVTFTSSVGGRTTATSSVRGSWLHVAFNPAQHVRFFSFHASCGLMFINACVRRATLFGILYFSLFVLVVMVGKTNMSRAYRWPLLVVTVLGVMVIQYGLHLRPPPSNEATSLNVYLKDWLVDVLSPKSASWVVEEGDLVQYFELKTNTSNLLLTMALWCTVVLHLVGLTYQRASNPTAADEPWRQKLSVSDRLRKHTAISLARRHGAMEFFKRLLPLPAGRRDFTRNATMAVSHHHHHLRDSTATQMSMGSLSSKNQHRLDKLQLFLYRRSPMMVLVAMFLHALYDGTTNLSVYKIAALCLVLLYLQNLHRLPWRGNRWWRYIAVFHGSWFALRLIMFIPRVVESQWAACTFQVLGVLPHASLLAGHQRIHYENAGTNCPGSPFTLVEFSVQAAMLALAVAQYAAFERSDYLFVLHFLHHQEVAAKRIGEAIRQARRVVVNEAKRHQKEEATNMEQQIGKILEARRRRSLPTMMHHADPVVSGDEYDNEPSRATSPRNGRGSPASVRASKRSSGLNNNNASAAAIPASTTTTTRNVPRQRDDDQHQLAEFAPVAAGTSSLHPSPRRPHSFYGEYHPQSPRGGSITGGVRDDLLDHPVVSDVGGDDDHHHEQADLLHLLDQTIDKRSLELLTNLGIQREQASHQRRLDRKAHQQQQQQQHGSSVYQQHQVIVPPSYTTSTGSVGRGGAGDDDGDRPPPPAHDRYSYPLRLSTPASSPAGNPSSHRSMHLPADGPSPTNNQYDPAQLILSRSEVATLYANESFLAHSVRPLSTASGGGAGVSHYFTPSAAPSQQPQQALATPSSRRSVTISKNNGKQSSQGARALLSMLIRALVGWFDRFILFLDRHSVGAGVVRLEPHMLPGHRMWYCAVRIYRCVFSFTHLIAYGLYCLQFALAPCALNAVLPISVFGYAAMMNPRPHRGYWRLCLIYIQLVILTKCLVRIGYCEPNLGNQVGKTVEVQYAAMEVSWLYARTCTSDFFLVDVILGLLCVLVTISHTAYLRSWGLWNDAELMYTTATEHHNQQPPSSSSAPRTSINHNGPPSAPPSTTTMPSNNHATTSATSGGPLQHNSTPATTSATHASSSSSVMDVLVSVWRNIRSNDGKLGTDVYRYGFACEILVVVITFFGYYNLVGSEDSLVNSLMSSLLPGTLAVVVLLLFSFIVVDRIVYLLRVLVANAVLNVLHAIFYHALMIWWFLHQTSFVRTYYRDNSFSVRGSLILASVLYVLKCVYMMCNAVQVRAGVPPNGQGHIAFVGSYSSQEYVIYMISRLMPFVFDMRVILDWAVVPSALKLPYWMKLEDVAHELYSLMCDKEDTRIAFIMNKKEKRAPYPGIFRHGIGWALFLLLTAILMFPLFLYSSFSPVLKDNFVSSVSCTLALEGSPPLWSSMNVLPTAGLTIDGDGVPFRLNSTTRELLERVRPTLVTSIIATDITQQIPLNSFSSSLWAVSPPTLQSMLTALGNLENSIALLLTISVDNYAAVDASSRTSVLVQSSLLSPETRGNLSAQLRGLQNRTRIPNLYTPFLLNRQSGTASFAPISNNGNTVDSSNTADCILSSNNGTATPSNTAFFTLQCTTVFLMSNVYKGPWVLSPDEKSCLDTDICPNYEDTRLWNQSRFAIAAPTIVVDSSAVLGASFLQTIGLVAAYTTFVLAVGRVLRFATTGSAFRTALEDLEDPDEMLTLLELIFFARSRSWYDVELELYAELIMLVKIDEDRHVDVIVQR